MNAKSYNGETPTRGASEKGHDDAVKLLSDNGADIEAKDSSGTDRSILLGQREMMRLFECWVLKRCEKRSSPSSCRTRNGDSLEYAA